MSKLLLCISCTVMAIHLDCFSQSKSEQIKQLQKIARDNEDRAKKAEELAEKYNRVAQEAQREAERQRYLSLAISLSRKSLDVNDSLLAALLSVQAHTFNKRSKGYEFDSDIYQGLLSALDGFGSGREKLGEHTSPVRSFIVKPDMHSILALEESGRVLRWSREDGEWGAKQLTPAKEGFDVLGACVREDGRLWVVGKKKRADSRVGIYDVTYSSRKIEGIHEEIGQVSFLRDASNFYALSSSGHSIFYCDPQKGSEVVRLGEKIISIDVSRDGTKLTGVTSNGNLYIWDAKKEYSHLVYKIGVEGNRVTALAFSPRGREIMLGMEKGEIKILVAENGALQKTLMGRFQVTQIAFSNLGNRMAVLDKLNEVRIWNLGDVSRWPMAFKERVGINSLIFSPDENELLCATSEKESSIHVWPLKAEIMAERICKFLPQNMSSDDWDQFVGPFPYEATCPNLQPNNR